MKSERVGRRVSRRLSAAIHCCETLLYYFYGFTSCAFDNYDKEYVGWKRTKSVSFSVFVPRNVDISVASRVWIKQQCQGYIGFDLRLAGMSIACTSPFHTLSVGSVCVMKMRLCKGWER